MAASLVRILDGNTFVVSDERGDIEASKTDPTGLFSYDTRFLSTWVLTINDIRLNALSTDDLQYFEARFFLVPATGTVYIDPKLSVIRQRAVGLGFHEELTIISHSAEPADLTIRIEAASRLRRPVRGQGRAPEAGHVRHQGRRPVAGARLPARDVPARDDDLGHRARHRRRARPDVHGHGRAARHLDHGPQRRDVAGRPRPAGHRDEVRPDEPQGASPNMDQSLETWINEAPHLECDWEPLKSTYRRSLVDLAALRFSPLIAGGRSLPAAGLPWFMTMFGRDSIFTSLQALPFAPELAATTLRVLGEWQGSRTDDFRDEDPGRILHEMRYGEMAAFEERPHSPYYGAVDATPLYVILLDEYERWTGDRALVTDLELEARAAINWIDQYADLMGNGYISYKRRNEQTGLENQSWKDSWNSISYADGRLPSFPRATCELQGYAYDAKIRGARLARLVWKDEAYADRLENEAADLKRRFNRDFWLADRGYYALALDADGSQVDSLASNNGLLLWSGIVDANKAKSVVGHLMGPRMWSGWGVRTLAEGEGRYNPIGYHLGHGLAVRQLVHRLGPAPVRVQGGGRADRGRDPRRRRGVRGPAARGVRRLRPERHQVPGQVPDGVQPAGVVDRRAAAAAADDARASSRSATTSSSTRRCRRRIGHLELLDIPGRWGRLDAFGRGRVHLHATSARPRSRRPDDGPRRTTTAHRDQRAEDEVTAARTAAADAVVIVGGGFAGVACARALAKHDDIDVTLIDKNDYHQFQPLLYQVATSMLAAGDIAYPLRKIAAEYDDFDGEARRGRLDRPGGEDRHDGHAARRYAGDYLVLAAGSQPNFFKTPGAEHAFPLYSLDDAERLRTRIIQAFEEADRDPDRDRRGRHRLRHRRRRPDRRRGGRARCPR